MKTTKHGSIILAEFKEKNIIELLFNHSNLMCIQICHTKLFVLKVAFN